MFWPFFCWLVGYVGENQNYINPCKNDVFFLRFKFKLGEGWLMEPEHPLKQTSLAPHPWYYQQGPLGVSYCFKARLVIVFRRVQGPLRSPRWAQKTFINGVKYQSFSPISREVNHSSYPPDFGTFIGCYG